MDYCFGKCSRPMCYNKFTEVPFWASSVVDYLLNIIKKYFFQKNFVSSNVLAICTGLMLYTNFKLKNWKCVHKSKLILEM